MTLSLNNIGTQKRKSKRIGRGNGSGHGTYSGKGMKGQKSRSGVSNLKRLGMKKMVLATPKLRGFKSDKPKNQIIKIESINENFKDGDKINPKVLSQKGLIKSSVLPVKILGKGELKVKVSFEGVKFSEALKGQIKK